MFFDLSFHYLGVWLGAGVWLRLVGRVLPAGRVDGRVVFAWCLMLYPHIFCPCGVVALLW